MSEFELENRPESPVLQTVHHSNQDLEKSERAAWAFFDLGHLLYSKGRDEEAMSQFEQALQFTHGDPDLLFEIYKTIGNIFVKEGDYDAAEENYNRAFAMNSNSDVLLVNYGTLEIQRGHLNEAADRFRQAVHINMSNDKAWVGLALTHRQFGDFDLSWANLDRALDINIGNTTALDLAIEWGARDYRLAPVVDRLYGYLSKAPKDANRRLALAKLLLLSGRLQEALDAINLLEKTTESSQQLYQLIQNEIKRQCERVECSNT